MLISCVTLSLSLSRVVSGLKATFSSTLLHNRSGQVRHRSSHCSENLKSRLSCDASNFMMPASWEKQVEGFFFFFFFFFFFYQLEIGVLKKKIYAVKILACFCLLFLVLCVCVFGYWLRVCSGSEACVCDGVKELDGK